MSKKIISIVIPVFKEEKNIPLIYIELKEVLEKIKENYHYEVIFINDGSTDLSWYQIEKLSLENKNIKGINLSRNFGKEIAISAGIESAIGNAVITIDGDGQHPVEKIPDFIKYWEKGYDIVYNKRPNTKGASFIKRLSSKIFYKIFNSISEFKLEPGTTDYRLLDKKVVDYYIQFQEKNRLYRGLTDWLGFNKKALVFDAKERLDGSDGSYTYSNLFKLAVDSLTSFSLFPLKLVGYFGVMVTFISVILLFIILFDKLFYNYFTFSNIAVIIVLNTILMGMIMISLGFIALYIGKIHEEVLGRPMYIIRDKINFKKK